MTTPHPGLFDAWSDLNLVICDWRSRFDWLREEFSTSRTRAEAERALAASGFAERYPLLPDWLT